MNIIVGGYGSVSAAGDDTRQLAESLFGHRVTRPALPAGRLDSVYAADYPVFQVSEAVRAQRHAAAESLSLLYARLAVDEALALASLSAADLRGRRVGVCLGSTVEASAFSLDFYRRARAGEAVSNAPFHRFATASVSDRLRAHYGWRGPSLTVTTACAAGSDAIGIGAEWIAGGLCDAVFAGGTDHLDLIPYTGFIRLMVTDREPCRPFSKDRRGVTLGEGAGVLLLLSPSAAAQLGVTPRGHVLGYGNWADGHHATAPEPGGRGLRRAIGDAMRQAGVIAGDLAFINAHGTGTADNDAAEAAVYTTLTAGAPVCATKSYTGHALAAAGGLEAVISLLALERGEIPKVNFFGAPDERLGLVPLLAGQPIAAGKTVALSNSLGLGGANAALVLGKAETASPLINSPSVKGWLRSRRGSSALKENQHQTLNYPVAPRHPFTEGEFYSADDDILVQACALARNGREAEAWFSPKELRRLDHYTKLALSAAARTLRHAGVDFAPEKNFGLVIASAQGPVRRSCDFMDSILDDGPLCASPLAFAASVHNVLETYLTLLLNLRGPTLTVSQKGGSFAAALAVARGWLRSGRCAKILLGVVDEIHPVTAQVNTAGIDARHLITDDGAAFFLLTLTPEPGARPLPAEVGDDWQAARRAARELTPLFTAGDTRRIAGDFIKTELARRKKDVLAVFASRAPEDLLADTDAATRGHILRGLLAIFNAGGENIPAENLSLSAALAACDEAVTASGGAFNFRTSGSTGEPVDCIHTPANLREEAAGFARLFPDIKRSVNVVPAHHAYGFLCGHLLPRWLGIPTLALAPLPSLPWRELLADGDLLVAFPMFLQQLADSDFTFPPGVTVVTATAPCPDPLLVELHRRGAARVVENYGASESGAIATREQPGAPFRLLPFWEPVMVSGRLERIVRKNSAMDLPLPDLAVMRGPDTFTISGRRDKAVQVAGINVYPEKVARFLRQHELVRDAAVRLAGEHLKAFVVPRAGVADADVVKILRAYLQALDAHEIPKELTLGPSLPVTAFGKKADW
ncbi:MAG: beta-ketoacyl synthase chain length factor [Verrucomicrobiales bacterium]|jgi:3-oxoacyl-[acyl-carrier-protein] synthase-1/3-oxoacyl-[acyl-carrier-protein] synthase II|nr:beta-ketoacyl synthase chain length factor [Verrucomicrobiales bacterium]